MSLLAHLYHISKSLNGKWVFRTNTNSIRFRRKTERERTLDSKIQVKSVHSTPQHRSTTNAFRLTRMLEQLPLPHVERSVCSVEIRHCQLATISHVANIFTWSILAALENKFWFVFFLVVEKKEPSSMLICWCLILQKDHLTCTQNPIDDVRTTRWSQSEDCT